LEGQNGKVSKKMSRKTSIQFHDSAVRAFNELKDNLIAQFNLIIINKEERYSRVPRLSDTRYSAKGTKEKSEKARLKCATYRR